MSALFQSHVPGIPCRRGKVRDVYDLGEHLAIVATDRISAFDWVLPTPIPDKGKVLTGLTVFWLRYLGVPNHLIATDPAEMGPTLAAHRDEFLGRTMLVRKAEVVPFECVARGYLAGSGWKEYQATQSVCGVPLPAGLLQASLLPEPVFTPATKAESGHDINVPFATMANAVGWETATDLKERTLDVYCRAAGYAAERGVIIADTKLEWGRLPSGELILIDEVLTPDSSRFWPKSQYRPGGSPPSYDKQFVRDWLETTPWDKNRPTPSDAGRSRHANTREVP